VLNATGTTVIRNGTIVDGIGSDPVRDGAVVIENGRLTFVGAAASLPNLPADAEPIDASGGTIMPGLVEPHWHASYFNVLELEDLDIKYPAEMVSIQATFNARLALECGYTSARSAGCLFNSDVWLAECIDTDLVPGPRFVPGGQEICGAGGLMDWNPEFRKIGMEGVILVVDGPDQARSAARRLVKKGAQWIKTYPTGDAAAPGTNDHHTLSMTFEEMAAAVVAVAHNHRRKVYGHCRATEGIKECAGRRLRLDRSAADRPKRPRSIDARSKYRAGTHGTSRSSISSRHSWSMNVPCSWNPHGDYAKELEFFVDEVGFSAMETLVCATRNGSKILGTDQDVGTLETGKLADVLVVAGDVLADISILQDRARLLAVIQGGIVKAGTLAVNRPTVVPTP